MSSPILGWQRRSLSRRIYLTLGLVIIVLLIFPYSYRSMGSRSGDIYGLPGAKKGGLKDGSEVYMTLLCPPDPHPTSNGGIDYYFEATRMLAYRLLHKAATRDTKGRNLVVLTTEAVLPEQIRALQDTGAIVGPNDTHAGNAFNAGMFFIKPSRKQADYIQSIYDEPIEGQDFTNGMEQDMLHYAYRYDGGYPWTRLSQMYNTQWPRLEDMDVSHALHDKMWKEDSPVQWDLRRYWYVAWGEMLGWTEERQRTYRG